ncbi:MAG: sigma-70 family RNA polymerase sigma factor [Deltaproteobacteria bacterium]|nr:sigma-70 family RNA polymerase sigma factor [Deltaproteobacteria bacterium]
MDTGHLWREFHDHLLAFILSRVADPAAAHDLLQQVFLKMHSSLSKGTAPEDPRAWVYAITRNAITDHHRRARSDGDRVRGLAAEPDPSEAEPEDGEDAASTELSACLVGFIDALDTPFRDALRWTALEGLTQAEAADRAGVSVSGMKSRVQRARGKLRGLLETCCSIELDPRGRPLEYTPRETGRDPCGCSGDPD